MKNNNNTEFDFRTIKDFKDACKKTGKSYFLRVCIIFLIRILLIKKYSSTLIAYYKLIIIFEAINNGWVPDWGDFDEYKYYAWYSVLASGFRFLYSYYGYDITLSYCGSRLCTFSSERIVYITETFEEEYKEMFLYPEK
ncbi:MAG: hypothetical protein NTZ33_13995 [Bacteroidetes bacterium]|nr:hypothetical protein [Bacteroidota bacterium]